MAVAVVPHETAVTVAAVPHETGATSSPSCPPQHHPRETWRLSCPRAVDFRFCLRAARAVGAEAGAARGPSASSSPSLASALAPSYLH